MDSNVQPIVGLRQELIVGSPTDNLQPVVALSKDGMKSEFSKRLSAALDSLDESFGCPRSDKYSGRIPWLANRFGVTPEAARKWLAGETIPDQTHMLIMIDDLQLRPGQLMGGLADDGLAADHFGIKLLRIWGELSKDAKRKLVAFAEVEAAITPKGSNPPKKAPRRRGEGAAKHPPLLSHHGK